MTQSCRATGLGKEVMPVTKKGLACTCGRYDPCPIHGQPAR